MAWKFHSESPIYVQIMDEIKLRIAQGRLAPGDKVPSVRDLAINAGVNPNTMQKALSELEREGILISERTSGRYVAQPMNGDAPLRATMAQGYVESFLSGMRGLGFSDEMILAELQQYITRTTT